MSSQAHAEGHHRNYVKIWGILVALLVVSVVGPMTGIRVVMLITAFGVALVTGEMLAGVLNDARTLRLDPKDARRIELQVGRRVFDEYLAFAISGGVRVRAGSGNGQVRVAFFPFQVRSNDL